MADKRRVLITGITGQDGSYLAELLLTKGYEVHGTIRRHSSPNFSRIKKIKDNLILHHADMTDPLSLHAAVQASNPHEVYNLAAQSQVQVSFEQPEYTYQTVAVGALNLLQAVLRMDNPARFYQASSSEMFGSSPPPQCETTPFKPCSPYACAKVAAFHQVINYREAYGLFACNGILFNHESPRRSEEFVTKKIAKAVAQIYVKRQSKLQLGCLTSKRDWGYAPDYVEAMWRMLQQNQPDDFVIATGHQWSVGDFLEMAFSVCGMEWGRHVELDQSLIRPVEVISLLGDASKAKQVLGWEPKTSVMELARLMVEYEVNKIAWE